MHRQQGSLKARQQSVRLLSDSHQHLGTTWQASYIQRSPVQHSSTKGVTKFGWYTCHANSCWISYFHSQCRACFDFAIWLMQQAKAINMYVYVGCALFVAGRRIVISCMHISLQEGASSIDDFGQSRLCSAVYKADRVTSEKEVGLVEGQLAVGDVTDCIK